MPEQYQENTMFAAWYLQSPVFHVFVVQVCALACHFSIISQNNQVTKHQSNNAEQGYSDAHPGHNSVW